MRGIRKCKVCGKETRNAVYCSRRCYGIDKFNKEFDFEKAKRMLQDYADGLSMEKIGEKEKMSKQSVSNIFKKIKNIIMLKS